MATSMTAGSGLAEKAVRIDDNLVRLQWGSAFVIVGDLGLGDRRDRAAVPRCPDGQGAGVLSQAARAQRLHGRDGVVRDPARRLGRAARRPRAQGHRRAGVRDDGRRRRPVRRSVRRPADRRVLHGPARARPTRSTRRASSSRRPTDGPRRAAPGSLEHRRLPSKNRSARDARVLQIDPVLALHRRST